MVCAHLFHCCGRKGAVDEGDIDACFFEDGGGCLAGEYAGFAGAALWALPFVSKEDLCARIKRLECGDDFVLQHADELCHFLAHRRHGGRREWRCTRCIDSYTSQRLDVFGERI